MMEFVNGKDYPIPYMKWKIIQMFQTTNQVGFPHLFDTSISLRAIDPPLSSTPTLKFPGESTSSLKCRCQQLGAISETASSTHHHWRFSGYTPSPHQTDHGNPWNLHRSRASQIIAKGLGIFQKDWFLHGTRWGLV